MIDGANIPRHFKELYRFAYRMLGRGDLAEEVAQEALTRLAAEAHPPEGEGARRWLFVVARNLCLSQLRRNARHPEVALDGAPEPHAGGPDPAEAAMAGERSRLVAEAIRELPPALREVIVLREYEGLDYARIAEVTGSSLAAVKTRISRGREELRRKLWGMMNDE